MTARIVILAVLALAWVRPSGARAQDRDALRRGHSAYDVADNTSAIPLLSAGLDPAAGPRDSVWTAGVHKLVDALVAQGDDSLAATWARWALRQSARFSVDALNFPPAVVQVFAEARRVVDQTRTPRGVTVGWRWEAGRGARAGRISIARAAVAVNARVGDGDFLTSGQSIAAAPGSHPLLATAEGYLPERAMIEVLPGVTTIVTFQLVPAAAGVLAIGSYPWGRVGIDGRPAGYSAALHRMSPGRHRVTVTREGYKPFDTTVTILKDDTTRIAARLTGNGTARSASSGAPYLLDVAAGAIDSIDVTRALARLREQLAQTPPSAASIRARIHGYAGLVFAAQASFDSARAAFQNAVREDPFTALDTNRANPDAAALFGSVRREVATLALRGPADTSLAPAAGWPVSLAVGAPGLVRLRLVREAPAPLDTTIATVRVDSTVEFTFSLRDSRGRVLEPGHYRLLGERVDGESGVTSTLELDVTRLSADTVAHDALPTLRPETRLGPPSAWSLARGLFFGAAAATLPIVLSGNESDGSGLDKRALTVSASLVTAGIVGVFAGRPRMAVPENAAFNQSLRGAWEARNTSIAAANEERRRQAPLRIQQGRS